MLGEKRARTVNLERERVLINHIIEIKNEEQLKRNESRAEVRK